MSTRVLNPAACTECGKKFIVGGYQSLLVIPAVFLPVIIGALAEHNITNYVIGGIICFSISLAILVKWFPLIPKE